MRSIIDDKDIYLERKLLGVGKIDEKFKELGLEIGRKYVMYWDRSKKGKELIYI